MGLGEYDESREQDIKNQISRISEELDRIAKKEEKRRKKRRDQGFDLVALAGYTNAGKSTLLRRLAAELDVDENDERHPDLEPTAESEDRLFTTLGTTTRKAKTGKRDVLLTDTVGFVSDLPHWLVESFSPRSRRSTTPTSCCWSSTPPSPSRRYARSWSPATTR